MGAASRALRDASAGEAFGLALVAGTAHAIAGPDHVAGVFAVATSARRVERARRMADGDDDDDDDDDEGSRRRLDLAWACARQGARWGSGHALGLALVGGIVLACEDGVDEDALGTASDFVVGSAMIWLGLATLRSAWRWDRKRKYAKAHVEDEAARDDDLAHAEDGATAGARTAGAVVVVAGSAAHAEAHALGVSHEHAHKSDVHGAREIRGEAISERRSLWNRVREMVGEESTREGKFAAFGVGVAHGVSGVSGVVYVLPAAFLADSTRVVLYIFGFIVSSVAAMTALAFLLGLLPRSAAVAFRFSVASGVSALVVGVIWVALVATGKLDL